uniref:Reverse transcriptase domain-containing protein n=1 Tax=Strongyloides papillosus TaxID=174720 RepID=A0A0N5C3V8_STREA
MEMTPKISYYSSKTLDMFARRKQLINELKLERKSNNPAKDISVLLLELSILKKSLRIQTSLDLETHRNKVIMNALEKRQSIKKARKQLMTRREVYEISTNDGISFYNELYNMNDNDAKMAKAALSNFKYLDSNKDEVLPFLEDEVSRTLLSMGRFKMVGPDKMCSDVLRFCGKILIQILTDRFNFYVKNCLTPKEWKKSTILLLHKKGSKSDISNFRPLSLTSHVYKIFSSLILSRMQNRLQKELCPYQYGFRKNKSICDAIIVVENILAKAYEYQWEIGVAFLDYTKAFDTIIRERIYETLALCGFESQLIKIIMDLNSDLKANVLGKWVRIEKGVRQGCPLSPVLFIIGLEGIKRLIDSKLNNKFAIWGHQYNMICYADDTAI